MKNIILGIIAIVVVLLIGKNIIFTPENADDRVEPNLLSGEYCFASQVKSNIPIAQADNFDYKFLKLVVDKEAVTGSIEIYNYGIDGSRGVLSGEIISNNESETIIEALDYYEAEGMIDTRERRIEIRDDNAYVAYGAMDENTGQLGWWKIPEISCIEYNRLHQKFE